MNIEPLAYFYKTHGIEMQQIAEVVVGTKYLAVILKDGRMGVCATLDMDVHFSLKEKNTINISNTNDRIFAQAYFNAVFNYERSYTTHSDIFDHLPFEKYKNIVMIGFFRSLAEKFDKDNIQLHIFDKMVSDSRLINMEQQLEYISTADAVILTSTSIFNLSFLPIVNQTKEKAKVFLLGPSTILHPAMFQYKNINMIFGSLFEAADERVITNIRSGKGTRSFLPYMDKVCFAYDDI